MTEGMYGIIVSCSREKLLMMAANKSTVLSSEDKHTLLPSIICLNPFPFAIKSNPKELGTIKKSTCCKNNQSITMTKDKAKPHYPHSTDRAQKINRLCTDHHLSWPSIKSWHTISHNSLGSPTDAAQVAVLTTENTI